MYPGEKEQKWVFTVTDKEIRFSLCISWAHLIDSGCHWWKQTVLASNMPTICSPRPLSWTFLELRRKLPGCSSRQVTGLCPDSLRGSGQQPGRWLSGTHLSLITAPRSLPTQLIIKRDPSRADFHIQSHCDFFFPRQWRFPLSHKSFWCTILSTGIL